jgi:vitamin B12 transporter
MALSRPVALAAACLAVLSAKPAAAERSLALIVDPRTTQVDSVDRLDETLEQVANSVSVITREEIELRGQPFVSDLLRTIPGVDVVQSGGRGGTTSVFIRGNNSEHTLVLLDGIPLNDPSAPGRTYDLANLTTDNVDRIEVLRGPQSVMYGSDAIGGVISIITRKGAGPLKTLAYGEWGAYQSSLYRGEVSGSAKRFDYSASASRLATGSIPSAASDDGNTIRDPYRNTTFSGALGIKPADDLRIDLSARNSDANFHLADQGGAGGDDPSYIGSSNETDLSARGTLSSYRGRLVQKLGIGVSTQNRLFLDDYSSVNPTSASNSSSYGQTTKASYQAVGRLADWNTLTVGAETQEERMHSSYTSQSSFGPFAAVIDNNDAYTKSFFAEDLIKLDGRFFLSAGGRRDRHTQFGGADTYRISPTVLIPETRTKLKASVGTGFKAPTLYQLFSQFGATNLAPERSSAWDAGVEQDFENEKVSLAATYFHNNIRDLISFNNATQLYYNVGRARTEGYELSSQVRPSDEIAFRSNFTYTSARDLDTGAALLRRPRIKFGGDVEARPTKGLSLVVGAVYTGPRVDNDFSISPARRVVLGGYGLWRLSGSYAVSKHVKLTARIDNVFNKRYEEAEGFGTLGIAGYGGLELQF